MLTTSATSCEGFSGFEKTAAVYDLIHKDRDLAREAKVVLEELGPPQLGRLVDWGCGTGAMLPHWRAGGWREAIGVDSSFEMCSIASGKGAGVLSGDIRKADFWGTAHVCLFAAFSYACLTNEDLNAALGNLRKNCFSGGMLVFDVVNYACCCSDLRRWITMPAGKDKARYVCRNVAKDFDPVSAIVTVKTDFSCHWYKEEPDEAKGDVTARLDRWTDIHKLRAFTPLEITAAMDRAGFDVVRQFDPETKGDVRGNSYYFMTTARAR